MDNNYKNYKNFLVAESKCNKLSDIITVNLQNEEKRFKLVFKKKYEGTGEIIFLKADDINIDIDNIDMNMAVYFVKKQFLKNDYNNKTDFEILLINC